MKRSLILLLGLAAACGDPTGSKPRGDPWTIIVTHAHLTDVLAQSYDHCIAIDDAGPADPFCSLQGQLDSAQVAAGYNYCSSLSADSLGARTVTVELRPSAGDTLRSTTWDPAAIPSADSTLGYGQAPTKPYFWHWYIANDSNVVRGDTARYIQPSNGQPCTF